MRNNKKKTLEQFIAEANTIHSNKYEYIGPYVNRFLKIRIKCQVHGEFMHYHPIRFRGIAFSKAVELFNLTQKHDKIKSECAYQNNIKLVRITYNDDIELCLKKLLDEHNLSEQKS